MSQNVPTTATTAAVTVQTPPVNAPATPPQRSSGEQRAAAIKAQLTAMEEAGETEPKDAKPAATKPKPAAKPEKPAGLDSAKPESKEAPEVERVEAAPEKDDDSEEEERARAKKESEARLARINAVRAKEQAAREENARRRQAKRPPAPAAAEQLAELESLRKRVAELEPESKAFASPLSMLEWAERKGHSPLDVANVLRQKLTDPNAIAEQHARSVEERIRAEQKAENEALKASLKRLEERLAEEKRAAREEAEAIAKTNDFLSRVKESESHPRTARLFRKDQGVFLNWINEQVVAHLPRGYTVDHLHDVTEQYLEWLQDGGDASPAENGASRPPKNGAAKPVTTLSNALTSGRNAVTEEKPLHLLSKKEREARLKAMLERE